MRLVLKPQSAAAVVLAMCQQPLLDPCQQPVLDHALITSVHMPVTAAKVLAVCYWLVPDRARESDYGSAAFPPAGPAAIVPAASACSRWY